jgi:hypothetical protein
MPTSITQARAEKIAQIFERFAKHYAGGIELDIPLLNQISRDLAREKVTTEELTQLDERPYALLSSNLASQSHWFMRRFRNSGGWKRVEDLAPRRP